MAGSEHAVAESRRGKHGPDGLHRAGLLNVDRMKRAVADRGGTWVPMGSSTPSRHQRTTNATPQSPRTTSHPRPSGECRSIRSRDKTCLLSRNARGHLDTNRVFTRDVTHLLPARDSAYPGRRALFSRHSPRLAASREQPSLDTNRSGSRATRTLHSTDAESCLERRRPCTRRMPRRFSTRAHPSLDIPLDVSRATTTRLSTRAQRAPPGPRSLRRRGCNLREPQEIP